MNYTQKMQVLKKAIIDNLQVRFTYRNETESRLINSHCIYIDNLGSTKLDAYQVSGHTNSQNEAFKCFFLNDMEEIEIVSTSFTENSQFNFNSIRYLNALVMIGG
jgi:hypothetical protein